MADTKTDYEQAEEIEEQAWQAREEAVEGMQKATEQSKSIMSQVMSTENIPSSVLTGLAGGSLIASLVLYILRKKEDAVFVGHWVPSLLLMSLFAKYIGKELLESSSRGQ